MTVSKTVAVVLVALVGAFAAAGAQEPGERKQKRSVHDDPQAQARKLRPLPVFDVFARASRTPPIWG